MTCTTTPAEIDRRVLKFLNGNCDEDDVWSLFDDVQLLYNDGLISKTIYAYYVDHLEARI